MSKRAYISRYSLILKKLKAKPYSSFEDLQRYIDKEMEFLQMQDDTLNMGFSKRTLQRDIKEIRNIFGINIEYSKQLKGYFISESENDNMNFQRMLDAFDLFNSLHLAEDLTSFVYFENRHPQGTENLYGLLHAIKNKLQIKFAYQKFWDNKSSLRLAEPYALKEFKNRWYVMAKDAKDNKVKSFALDRLTELEITRKKFKLSEEQNIKQTYQYCFGIICPDDETEPQQIILSFDPFQGNYIKTLPLHNTQKILIDNENELRIQLKLFITHDLVMELLSFGDNVEIIKPKSLIKQVKKLHDDASKQYD